MNNSGVFLRIFFATVSLFTCSVVAGFNPDINTMDGYTGSTDIDLSGAVGADSYNITGTIAYAVYEPGQYSGSVEIDEDHYVYAYQIFNDSGNVPIGYLSVGLTPGASAENVFSETLFSGSAADVDPAFYDRVAQEVLYLFSAESIGSGRHSYLLMFASPHAPVGGLGTVSLGSLGGQVVTLPVPIPEPMTLVLLATGLIQLRYAERRRRLVA